MNLFEFTKRFGSERDCRYDWKTKREAQGMSCQSCHSKGLIWREKRWEWRCLHCHTSLTLRSGTVMENSKLPFAIWYQAMFLMVQTKKGLSAKEMQRQLGWKRYEPIWLMMHKLRVTMGKCEDQSQLSGNVEVDDAYVKTLTNNRKKRQETDGYNKRGRGNETSNPIVVMTTIKKVKRPGKGRPGFYPQQVKIYKVPTVKAQALSDRIEPAVNGSSTLITDGFVAYIPIGKKFLSHQRIIVPASKAHIMLPSVHTLIGNFKRYVNGVLHHIDEKYLQHYLAEFCFKVNRRYANSIFRNLVWAGIAMDWGENG